jgi:hypothetical protein
MKGLVEGKIALVTGAGAGIGAAISELLAEHGAMVAVVEVNEEFGKRTVAAIEKAGGNAKFYCCDVGNLEQIQKAFEAVIRDYGRVDILVNNCGIANGDLIADLSEENWHRILNVNMTAMYRFAKLAVTDMLKRKDGAIVNISSLGGLIGGPNGLVYCTSKFGVNGLTRALAADHAKDGIRVNAVAPGMTYTDMARKGFESKGDAAKAKAGLERALPIGRMASPREIAYGVLFFASEMGSYCAGSILPIDGGVTGCFWPFGS